MLIQNATQIIEKGKITYLVSTHTHDFVSYKFANGEIYFADGGLSYYRRGYKKIPEGVEINNFCLDDESSASPSTFLEIREKLLWGSRGIDGKQPLTFKPIKECDRAH